MTVWFNIVLGSVWVLGGLTLLSSVLRLAVRADRFATNVAMSESTSLKLALLAACGVAGLIGLGFGVWTFAKRRSRATFQLNLALVVSAVLALGVLEAVARVSIARGWAPFNDERLYANRLCREDYWRLRAARLGIETPPERYHPVLGWTAPRWRSPLSRPPAFPT